MAIAPPAAPANGARQRVVQPGHSIQAALDSAAPGDTVVVKPGVYRENLEITKDRVTLRGHGARVDPPAVSTPRRCSTFFGAEENPYGICVAGELDPVTRQVVRPVQGVRIEGMKVGAFPDSGIIVFGGDGTQLRNNDIAGGLGDGGYSILMLRSLNNQVTGNRVHGAGGAGIYIGSSPDARSVISHNIAFDSGSFGIMVRDSVSGTVEHNLVYGNCMGIGFVDGLSAGTAEGWTARHNTVLSNTDVCPGGEEPDVSGVGILLAGARSITVTQNVVAGNVSASDRVPYAGGVVLASGSLFGGTEVATGNVVTRNTVLGNRPFDLNLVEVGPGNQLTRNTCGTGSSPGLCAR
jgi:parallel beta-helix repeat protein